MREKRGLANQESPAWTVEEIALLGTAPDPALARQLGRTAHAVAVKRFKLKIPRFHKQGD